MSESFEISEIPIVYEDEHFIIVDKPSGMFVHPPPVSPFKLRDSQILIKILRLQLGLKLYPAHRLDYGTSGLVLLAKSRRDVALAADLFRERKITKQYWCVARGILAPEGEINLPLETNFGQEISEAKTSFRCLATVELPYAVSKRYPTSRYSLAQASPHTGRWHQIRRHFDRTSHPLIGDIEHGDTAHNRFFRDELKIPGLLLRASSLQFNHPHSQQNMIVLAPEDAKWKQIESLFNSKALLDNWNTKL